MSRSYLHYPFWGIFSTVLLLYTNSLIGLTTSTTTAPLSENEFEFDDNDFTLMQKSKVVTTFIDDEDLLSDAGSGDEGSGLKNTAIYPDFYRIQFYITYISNTDGLSDRHSENFRRVSSDINTAISSLYNKAVRVSVYRYELKEQGAIVSMDLGTRENMNVLVIKGLLSTQLKTGRLGNFRVSDEGFSFRSLGDTSCPTEVGRKPTQLAWTGENLARLMVNNMFPCDGYVTGWAYYVSRPTETFAATIWRPVDEFKFYLLSKHLLPATQMGYNEFTLSNHVKVEKGDFIGLHYPKSATSGAIAGSTRDRSDVPAAELYEVYTGELFDGQMSVNAEFDMKWLNFQKTRASFAIQAKMNYSGIADTFPPIEQCAENEFKCRDGTCIQKNYYCDHQLDCPDGSDEENCGAGCQSNEFRCRSGDCVPYSSYCDNRRDCADGSDEEDCPLCAATEFRCGDGSCVNEMKRCDSHVDCTDASDEYGCANRTCSDAHYRCNTGQCIPVNLVCDNKRDCPDGSDEVRQACDFVCKPGGFKCNDGSCIREEQKCDRNPDCSDGSDELNCDTVCRLGEFRCQNGDCIPESRRCDSFLDCRDATDEFNCQCTTGQFRCRNGQCINEQGVCNRRRECQDGSDEEDCPLVSCQPHEFQCRNGQCIDARRKCDQYPDCEDRSDETECPAQSCQPNQFQCRNDQCININKKCDRHYDCSDGSDEQDCTEQRCLPNQFECRNGQCIDVSKKCDRRYDCADLSDEDDCSIPQRCQPNQFECKNGQCIDANQKCNRHYDCSDGSDEQECPIAQRCQPNQFECKNGQCIDASQKCNRHYDCSDGSDEQECPECQTDQFQCRDGQCIEKRRKCDGRYDCRDRSDEETCPPRRTCPENNFMCGTGHCLPEDRHCNGWEDCPDGSDEVDCLVVTCSPDEFTCGNGECISSTKVCNRQYDCRDGSDERNCTQCRPGQFRCKNGRCIPESRICDQRNDCSDGSDESDCAACRASEFKCKSGECISVRQKCDSRKDCLDGSDEMGCESTFTISINPGSLRVRTGSRAVFTCDVRGASVQRVEWHRRSGSPIPELRSSISGNRLVINEIQPDDADDYICTININGQSVTATANLGVDLLIPFVVTVTPRVLTVQEGETAKFMCQMSGHYSVTLQWTRSQRRALSSRATDQEGILMISSVTKEDSGEYICNAYGDQGRTSGSVQLIVNGIGPEKERPEGPCRRGEATCNNGECIPADYRCDGEEDCTDGSDEFQCSQPLPCEPNEFKCRNGQCAMKIWRCDGDNDCGDGSDEENCPTGPPGSMCQMDEFRCIARHQCIPSSYQCDGENDCLDRSDEMGCRPPTIISPPIKDIEVEIGGTFTIFCKAIGIPVPLIIWRLNWGNIPSGDRVVTTSKEGQGMLTISNARLEDAGAYTCEAMNNKGSIFALPDAIVIVKRPSGNCPPPVFNAIAASREECIQCFCFKRTIQCDSSNLKKVWLSMGSHINLVSRRGDTLPDLKENYIKYDGAKREFRIPSYQFLPSGVYYFSLPYQFLGNRLTSYGGELNYKVFYEIAGVPVLVDEPDVILTGNGITLYHTVSRKLTPNREHTIKVSLREQVWQKGSSDPRDRIRSDTPAVEAATRDDLMEVLSNVTSIMIKATIDSSQTDIRINGIVMNSGTPQGRGDRTVLVEECDCPTGYDGLSCEKCTKGYHMINQGRYGTCIPCNCNGRSNDCDPVTGECIDCQGNTGGARCDICEEGYYGNPLQGIDCKPCPCPHTSGPNQFSRRCELRRDGRVRCLNCPEGYAGNQCEICAEGYIGNPRVAGDYCRPLDEACDLRGSRSTDPNPVTNRCDCKANTKGERCDRCIQGSFFLSKYNPEGCISCFCMGVTEHCTSTSRRRTQIGTSFVGDRAGFSLVNMEQTKRIITDFTVNSQNDLVYRNFYVQPKQVYYWSLPDRYLGNKLTAYGGFLRFTISNLPGINNSPTARAADVEIMGNDIMLFYFKGNVTQDRPTSFEIPMYEHHWKMANGNWATREYLLMALADLRSILIKATYTVDTNMATIRDVTLDIAEQRVSGERADAVEECSCPTGYRGLSCESCDVGYMRTVQGLYLGLCEECHCNGHSSECDPETGKCRNCQHNTEGEHCDRCAPGYYGNATVGSIYDCMKCPCPLTEQPNQFSPTCYMDRDGRATCNACPVGHTGRNCEKCLQGFSGNPLHPGDYCKADQVDSCDCDSRGTIKNTQCDSNTKQCQCKAYVRRLKCDSCKQNYFHLSQDNPQGCLACYCMGITNKCTSSNFYRTKVTPLFATDGSHNFILTNRAMSRTINDGFKVDASREQITFESFTDVQRERESLYFQLPPKFRGDKVSAYGGYLEFTLEFTTAQGQGNFFRETDVEIISSGQRLHYLFSTQAQESRPNTYKIHLVEQSFNMWDGSKPSREVFMTVLANIDAILIRATYHTVMTRATLRDVSIEIAVPEPTGQHKAPMVEKCDCPEGYTGLSCQECALGYSRIKDEGTGLGRCGRCNCHSHSSTCDPRTGKCLNCKHNTMGDHCEICKPGHYGDASVGTTGDCRPCACPLTIPSNNFSPTCYLAQDSKITCDKCQQGYSGRNCDICAAGYSGNPREPGGFCRPTGQDETPRVIVNPINIKETIGNTAIFTCRAESREAATIVWSRVDGRRLPSRAQQNYRNELIIENLTPVDTGRYVCIATNIHGSSKQFVELIVSRSIQFQVRIEEPTERNVDEGATVRLVCSLVGQHSSAYVLSWSKVNGVLPSSALEFDGVLTLDNIKKEDAGEYKCTGSDPENFATSIAVITVGTSTSPPDVQIEPRYQSVSVGQSAKFTCTATGNPKPTITWYKGENQPVGNGAIVRDGVLSFPLVTKLHESEYYCAATNSMGTTKVRTIMYVTGDSPTLEIIIRQQSIVTSVGKRIELVCSVQENGQLVNLVWTKQDGPLPSGATQRNGVLVIDNAKPSDSGVYICTGSTQTGSTGTNRAVVRISTQPVGVRPTARIEPEGLITIGQKTTGTLRCIVTGEPTPTITWSKARGELSSNHQVNGNLLRITETMVEDRGVYICKASNIAGTVQASAIVEVERRELPKIDMYPKQSQTVSIGGSTLFQCRLAAGIPSPVLTWTREGGEAMTSHVQVVENGVIRFTGVSSEDQGGYICSATNAVGTITATATLLVTGPPKILINQRQIRVKVGDHVRIECAAEGDPAPNVYWQHQVPHSFDFGSSPAARQSIAVLEINSVNIQDAKYYVCVAENEGGRAQERVELIVERTGVIVPPRNRNRLNVNEGEKVEVTCETQGFTGSRITWRRRRGPLPPGHSVSNGILTIPRITKDYDGEYVCTTTTPEGTFEVSFLIIVSVAPRITISPSNISTRPGEPLRLHCRAEGSGPISIEWMKTNGVISPTVEERNGVLIFKEVTAADAGEYRCIAKSSSGVATGIVLVKVVVQPIVTVNQNQVNVRRGQTVTLECQSTGTPRPTIRWEKSGGALPANHEIRDGVLTIFGVTEDDEGRYICTATNEGGSARDYIYLRFTTIHRPEERPKSTQTTNVGDKVEFDCIVSTIQPNPKMTWSKVEGPISEKAIYGNGVLIIPKVELEDAGTYVCTLSMPSGEVVESKISLFVKSARPVINIPENFNTAPLGTPTTLGCSARGSPEPLITWTKENGDLPSEHSIVDGNLYIPKVRPEDAGTYYCSATNTYDTVRHAVTLQVSDLIPNFVQNPISYIEYPPLKNAYLDFNILVSFRPSATDGLILYNGQETENGDFLCFGLRERYPEFRFNVGSGPAIIQGNQTLELDKWYTIQLKRDRREGMMLIDGQPVYSGTAPGRFQGLDLDQSFYLGGVPDFRVIPQSVGFEQGFVGGVSQVQIGGKPLDLGGDALNVVGIDQFRVCNDHSCYNGGSCIPKNMEHGFTCMCPRGFAGFQCETTGERCFPGACGPTGRCQDLPGLAGFKCVCPIGRLGRGCQEGMTVKDPFFNKTSFISYPPIENGHKMLTIDILMKPHLLHEGIILYSGQQENGQGDFVALVMKEGGYLEFRFDVGSGPAIIRSAEPVHAKEWINVHIHRDGNMGFMEIDGQDIVREGHETINKDPFISRGDSSPGDRIGLNLRLPLYLGGVDPRFTVASGVGSSDGFVGCIGEIEINDRSIHLIKDAVESSDINDCGEKRLCDRMPCKNGGLCEDVSSTEFLCICEPNFSGKRCESKVDICTNNPCQNAGICTVTNAGYRCDCQLGYIGLNCENPIQLNKKFQLGGNGFVIFSHEMLPHQTIKQTQNINFTITTAESKGLLFWQAVDHGQSIRKNDYLSIYLKDGFVVFSYELGSGPSEILTNFTVNDSLPHNIQAIRTGRQGQLIVDGQHFRGRSQGVLQMLNVKGNIFVGGVPDLSAMTGGLHDTNFFGCMNNIFINGNGPLKLSQSAIGGLNVRHCASPHGGRG